MSDRGNDPAAPGREETRAPDGERGRTPDSERGRAPDSERGRAPGAHVRRSKFSLVWLIPLLALAVAGYLGVRTVRSEGPRITLTFKTGDGLVAGQTRVRHKAVELGQVETVRLSDDMQSVQVQVRMMRDAAPY
ncbi:MAG: MlaD family protein, partial [Janthinobacterium lividum]